MTKRLKKVNGDATAVLAFSDVSKAFLVDGKPRRVVNKLSFTLYEGEFLTIVGKSGCGKTTILRLAAGIISPDEGQVKRVKNSLGAEDAHMRRQLSMVFQQPALLPWRTALQNISLPWEIRGANPRHEELDALLTLMGLAGSGNLYPHELSQGMQSRVAMARALAVEADLMLMDEPLGHLDELTRVSIQDEILRVHKSMGRSSLYVTHDLTEAVFLSDRLLAFGNFCGAPYQEVMVPFPREARTADIRKAPEFVELVEGTRGYIMEQSETTD